MYYIHIYIYIYLCVFTYIYIYIYLWFISLPITLPISQLQGSSNPSQARQMWALHPAVSFGATPDTQTDSPLNYKEFVVLMWNCWSGVHGRGMLCHFWCFLHVVSVSWCLWVWAWNNYTYNYYYASPSSFQMLTQLPGAMLIQNVLLGSIPPLGHTFGTKGRRFLLGRCKHPVRLQHVPGEFLGKLWTDSLPRCTNAASDWVKVIISPLAGLILPVALPIRPLGLVVPSLSWLWASPFSPWEPWAPHVCNTSAIRRPGLFDGQMDGYRFWIVLVSEYSPKFRKNPGWIRNCLVIHSLVQSVRLTISVFTCQIRGGQHHVDRAWKDVNVRMVRIQKIAIDMPGSDVLPHLLCTIKEWNYMAHLTRDWSILGHPT